MKLALDFGTRYTSAAWTTAGSPDLLPLRMGNPFLENILLWRNNKVVAIDDDARSQLSQDSMLLQSFKPDLARHRLRWTEGLASRGHSEIRRATSVGSLPVPKDRIGEGYTGPFYRHGLVRAIGGMLRHLWAHLHKLDPGLTNACDSLVIGVPYAFHEFSRRRLMHALKEGLADELFPEPDFYRQALQAVSFVHEPLAVLASIDHLYDGRASTTFSSVRPESLLVVDIGAGFCSAAVFQTQPGRDDLALTPGRMIGERTTQFAGDAIDAAMLDGVRGLDPDLDVFICNRFNDAAFRMLLLDNIRRAKIQLCDPAVGEVSLQVPEADYVAIQRPAFTDWIRPVARRAAETAIEAVADAGMGTSEVGGVLMVGGTCLIPEVRAAIAAEFQGRPIVMPDRPNDVKDALGAVACGLARYEVVADPAGMRPGNRRIGLYNSGWAPQEQFPPQSEQFVLLYDPLKPDEHKHKDFWWGFLQVPPGFGKLTVTLFESVDREEHLFTLYGIPVADGGDLCIPERFQVYIDVTGERMFPRIWVWDVNARKFMVKAFDLSKQAENRLAEWIEAELPAFSYWDGDVFHGKPDATMGWIPAVKRPAVGDVVRVVSGDRTNADWVNKPGASGLIAPATIRGVWPRGTSAPTGKGINEVRNWHISEFMLKLDDKQPANYQNLFIEYVPDGHRDSQMLVVDVEHRLAPLQSMSDDTLANQMGTVPVKTETRSSGRMSRAPRLAADAAPSLASSQAQGSTPPAGDDPFGVAGAMFESSAMPTVFDTGQIPVEEAFGGPAGAAAAAAARAASAPKTAPGGSRRDPGDPFGGMNGDPDESVADASVMTRSWTSAHAAWNAGQQDVPTDAPESWAESSAGGDDDHARRDLRKTAAGALATASLPTVLKSLRESGVPTDRAEARALLHRLLRQAIDGDVSAPVASAAAVIIQALFALGHGD
ncbi:MAG: Hsp70 family protein [Planctomycetota bacterium]